MRLRWPTDTTDNGDLSEEVSQDFVLGSLQVFRFVPTLSNFVFEGLQSFSHERRNNLKLSHFFLCLSRHLLRCHVLGHLGNRRLRRCQLFVFLHDCLHQLLPLIRAIICRVLSPLRHLLTLCGLRLLHRILVLSSGLGSISPFVLVLVLLWLLGIVVLVGPTSPSFGGIVFALLSLLVVVVLALVSLRVLRLLRIVVAMGLVRCCLDRLGGRPLVRLLHT